MNVFKELFTGLAGFKSLREAIDKNISPVSVTGLSHIHRAQLVHALGGKKINLLITGTEAEAKKLSDDINMMAGCEEAVLFPSKELVFTPVDSTNHEYEHMRIAALIKAAKSRCSVICASIEAVMQPVIPVGVLIAAGIAVSVRWRMSAKEAADPVLLGEPVYEIADGEPTIGTHFNAVLKYRLPWSDSFKLAAADPGKNLQLTSDPEVRRSRIRWG